MAALLSEVNEVLRAFNDAGSTPLEKARARKKAASLVSDAQAIIADLLAKGDEARSALMKSLNIGPSTPISDADLLSAAQGAMAEKAAFIEIMRAHQESLRQLREQLENLSDNSDDPDDPNAPR